MSVDIKITDRVFARVAELASANKDGRNALRISVDGGGCSGFTYKYEMVPGGELEDLIFENHGIRVFIDPMSLEFMEGSIVDFIEELGASYFSIKNPKATAKCGCGSSFAV